MHTNASHAGGFDQEFTGFIDTSTVLERIHDAARAAAMEWSGRRCVTISVGNIALGARIECGHAVSTDARVIYTHDDTMDVLVTVCVAAEQIAQCSIIFGAVDDMGRAVAVQPWHPETMLQLQQHRQARSRERIRMRIEELIVAVADAGAGAAPKLTVRHTVAAGTRIRGGELLAWMDRACNAVGADWTGLELATSYVAGVHFDGHAVAGPTFEVTARLIHTASHSLHFGAQVNGAARAVLVLGARDDNGVARPVRQWLPGSDDGRRCRNDARRLVEMRQFVEPFSSRPSATRPTEDDPWIARGRSA